MHTDIREFELKIQESATRTTTMAEVAAAAGYPLKSWTRSGDTTDTS